MRQEGEAEGKPYKLSAIKHRKWRQTIANGLYRHPRKCSERFHDENVFWSFFHEYLHLKL